MLGVPETNQNTYGLTYLNKKTMQAQDAAALMIGKKPQLASETASKLIDEHANIPKVDDEVKPIHDKDTKFFTDNGKEIDHKTHAGLMNGKVLHTRNNESGKIVTTAEEVPLKISSVGGGSKYPKIGNKKVDIKDMGKRGGARKHIKNASVDELVYTVTYNNLIIKGMDEITAKLRMILLGGEHTTNQYKTDRRHTIEVNGRMEKNPDFGKTIKNPFWKGDRTIEETRTSRGTNDHSNTAHNGRDFNTAFVTNQLALNENPNNVETLSEGHDNVKTDPKPKVEEGKPVKTKKPTKIKNPKAGDARFYGTGNSKGYGS